MKAARFDFARANSIEEAKKLLSSDNAKILAGGQSLGPMLNLRLVRPALLVDVTKIAELKAVNESTAGVVYGACVTHADIEDKLVPDVTRGILPRVAAYIAYRSVRNRGTVGGSLAHADPAGDWPNVLLALGATVRISKNAHVVEGDLESFTLGAFTTLLEADDIIVGIAIPRTSPRAKWGYWKLCRKLGDYAEAMCAVYIDKDRKVYRAVIGATDGKPILITGQDNLSDAQSLERAVKAASLDLPPIKLQQRVGAAVRAFNSAITV